MWSPSIGFTIQLLHASVSVQDRLNEIKQRSYIGTILKNSCDNGISIMEMESRNVARKLNLPNQLTLVYWYDSAIKPRICKVLEKNFWGGSIIKWVILYPKHRTSGCHVIGSRDNHVSKFEVPKNVGSFFWYLHWIFPDFLSIDEFSIV